MTRPDTKLPAILALVLVASFPAPAAAGGTGTLKGVVYDSTCYGPCVYPPPPPRRYTGDNLAVTVRRLPTRRLIAKLHPADGTFRVHVASGLYRVRATVGRNDPCWQGEHKRARVVRGEVTRVKLHVYNGCIV